MTEPLLHRLELVTYPDGYGTARCGQRVTAAELEDQRYAVDRQNCPKCYPKPEKKP